MPRNRDSGLKAAATNKKNDPKYYQRIGTSGGKAITENTKRRGFASMSPERRTELARIAGRKSVESRKSNGN